MKLKRLLSCFLALAMMTSMVSFQTSAYEGSSNNEGYTIDEPYEYPIEPGTDEWFAIESHAEKVEMLQIPQDVLNEMTTEALVESVVNYPYFPDMDSFSTQELGYETVRNGFNGLQELESRPDGMLCLAEYYEEQQTTRSSGMSYVVRRAIEITLEENSEEWENQQNIEITRVSLPRTPSGNQVTSSWCHYDRSEMTAGDRTEINEYVRDAYGLEPLRPPTTKYNCHSYAWYNRSSSNLWWIDWPDDFMEDDYYEENTGIIKSGNIAVYRMSASSTEYLHSAVVTNVGSGSGSNPPITVTSKWGNWGLYSHMLYNCPADYGRNMLFYQEA